MIRYALVCDKAHAFDSWFPNADAFDRQAGSGLVECPTCGSARVEKAIMAPQVARKDRGDDLPAKVPQPVAMAGPQEAEFRAKLRELRDLMTRNSDYVGEKFAQEALKIHFGETDPRTIHGEASPEEVRSLLEEGVAIHPIPVVPDDRN